MTSVDGATGGSTIEIHTAGDVDAQEVERARAVVDATARLATRPLRFAHLDLIMSADPSRERPAEAKARLDLDGRLVRAHVAAETMTEAVDFVELRLRRNVERAMRAPADDTLRHRDDAWHHGDERTRRPSFFPRPPEEREIVRRKTLARVPITPEEAVEEAILLDHEFFLFTNVDTDRDAVVHLADRDWVLIEPPEVRDHTTAVPHDREVAAELDVENARDLLDLGNEPFVFFVDPDSGRGTLLYRRYDGHYGLITTGK